MVMTQCKVHQEVQILISNNNKTNNNNSNKMAFLLSHQRHSVNSNPIFSNNCNKKTNPFNHKSKSYLHKNKSVTLIFGIEESTKVGTSF